MDGILGTQSTVGMLSADTFPRYAVRISDVATQPQESVRMMDVLQLDVSGRPQAWITAKEAAVIYASDGVAWTLGEAFHVMRGGIQRATGLQSRIEVHSIIAVRATATSAPIAASATRSTT
jgi:hypothetical protein